MKIKLDENLPASAAEVLRRLEHDVDTVLDEGYQGCNDNTVSTAAQEAGRFLITQDLDFSDLRRFAFSRHHGILVIRLREPGRRALLERMESIFAAEDTSSWAGCFIVATEHKLRIRRPELK